MHKGTSEAQALPESKHVCCSKGIFLWVEGKRKRFPLQPFEGPVNVFCSIILL